MEKTLKEKIQEDETIDYQLKDWERFKEETFLEEYKTDEKEGRE